MLEDEVCKILRFPRARCTIPRIKQVSALRFRKRCKNKSRLSPGRSRVIANPLPVGHLRCFLSLQSLFWRRLQIADFWSEERVTRAFSFQRTCCGCESPRRHRAQLNLAEFLMAHELGAYHRAAESQPFGPPRTVLQTIGASGGSPSAARASWHCSSPACKATQQLGRVG